MKRETSLPLFDAWTYISTLAESDALVKIWPNVSPQFIKGVDRPNKAIYVEDMETGRNELVFIGDAPSRIIIVGSETQAPSI